MAKKREPTEQLENSVAPPAGDTAPYLLGQWNGLTQYRCPHCPFDSLDESELLAHLAQHSPPEPPRIVSEQLVDRYGNPLEVNNDA